MNLLLHEDETPRFAIQVILTIVNKKNTHIILLLFGWSRFGRLRNLRFIRSCSIPSLNSGVNAGLTVDADVTAADAVAAATAVVVAAGGQRTDVGAAGILR